MSSLANRTAAIMEAEITSVDANRSLIRACLSSCAVARFISPMTRSIGEDKAKIIRNL